jgi:hypothetical protein
VARVGQEAKPFWRDVPATVRQETARQLGAPVRRAERAFGGYGPSATFRLLLADGRRAFFKGVYPLPASSPVRWVLDREERVFQSLSDLISPWAPAYYGSVRGEGWHALLLEDVGPDTVPPWTRAKARAATRAYADFHASSLGHRMPRWLPRIASSPSRGRSWERMREKPGDLSRLARLAGPRAAQARRWLDRCLPALDESARAILTARGPHALLHLDTRSDNLRVHPTAPVPLRIFDWPFAQVGPPELDFMPYAQAVTAEGGPEPETLTAWYAEVLPLRPRILASAAAHFAGFFAERAWQPDPEGLPRLRPWQRQQLKVSLAWAARLLDLPEPAWLEEVPS